MVLGATRWGCSRADAISRFCAPLFPGGSWNVSFEPESYTGAVHKEYCRKRLTYTTHNGATFYSKYMINHSVSLVARVTQAHCATVF